MKKTILPIFALLLSLATFAQKPAKLAYQFTVDINKINNDKVQVSLNVPRFGESQLTYHLPKIVPGTYHIYDFGRFVSNFKALNTNGEELVVSSPDSNTWVISRAQDLATITYDVDDTWDTELANVVFEPAGTNISDKAFVFNNHGFFGYFQDHQALPYYVTIDRPASYYGSTALQRIGGSDTQDAFFAETYNYLVDGPIMYCKPDTTWLQVGNAKVLVSVYSPNGTVTSKSIASEIGPTLDAQRKYLGGTLPVDHYAFLVFLTDGSYLSGSAGALEHSYSSFYCLFEGEPQQIGQMVRDVSAHEFFHIITPLNIHSEEIQDFDFINPKMSEHLWMYEGVTEYSAHHAQVKGGMTTIEHFIKEMHDKMVNADRYKQDLSFTEMSLGCLDKYEDQYTNVYQEGALIGMCLDIKLRLLTQGKYGIQNLMQDLAKKYGKDKAFKDKDLFADIEAITKSKEIADFLKRYVAGAEPLPFAALLKEVGIKYTAKGKSKELSPLGGLETPGALGFDLVMFKLKVEDEKKLDAFGQKSFKFKKGDIIMDWNGEDLGLANVNEVLGKYVTTMKEGDEVVVTVMREGKPVTLKTKLKKMTVVTKHILTINKKAKKAQLDMRKAWLGDYKSEE